MMHRKVGRLEDDLLESTTEDNHISDRVRRIALQKRYSIVAVCQSQLLQTNFTLPSLRYLTHHCPHGRLVLPNKERGATRLVLDPELPEALVTIVLADL
jgi:hypothetical protein